MLGSGSRGNAAVVECGDVRILIDAGFPARTLAQRMRSVGVEPESISHCVITHEHQDHCRGAGVAARRWGWELHATAGTLAQCADLAGSRLSTITTGTAIRFGNLELVAHRTPHDAAASIALLMTSLTTGTRTGIAYDLGSVPDSICDAFAGVDILVAEANHDVEMLRTGPYPFVVQKRIASRTGHLSNAACSEFVRRCVGRGTSHVVLAHMSEKCNEPGMAHDEVSKGLRRVRFSGKLSIAEQDVVLGPVEPGRQSTMAGAGGQLEFGW
ncbi:MAG TPA: MBL fold metallo-hydrolase [Gemmatimonadales bacterium]|nr:MBL fold metallo-hydrolase [Gemmatimonadales bacterium]